MVIVYRQLVALAFSYPMEEGKGSGRERNCSSFTLYCKTTGVFPSEILSSTPNSKHQYILVMSRMKMLKHDYIGLKKEWQSWLVPLSTDKLDMNVMQETDKSSWNSQLSVILTELSLC